MREEILIPEKRISVLKKMKEDIEEGTKTKIYINDAVIIEGETLNLLTAGNIVKAIGRGFSTEAFDLLDENCTLCIISLPHNRKALIRIKARIIGKDGRVKKNIERLTNTKISIYGKTVSVIGNYEDVDKARVAIGKLIGGSTHKNVYRFLELGR